MARPPAGCWSCGAVPSKGDIAARGFLRARSAGEGGPWTRIACRSCGEEGVLGRGDVLAPPLAIGLEVPLVASLLEGRWGRILRRRAREWVERYGAGFVPAPGSPGPAPAPRRRAPSGLPATPSEARAVLGLEPAATRKEIDAAFRRAVRRCHPDLFARRDREVQRRAHEAFLRVRRAHEVLTR